MPELLPCPFCGGKAVYHSLNLNSGRSYYSLICACGGQNGSYETKAEAAEAWNRRAEERTCRFEGITGNPMDEAHCNLYGFNLFGGLATQINHCPGCGVRIIREVQA